MNKHTEGALSQLSVVVILGFVPFVKNLVHSLDKESGIGLISIDDHMERCTQLGLPFDPISVFMNESDLAISNGKQIVVVTGFPKNYTDACHVNDCCPHLLTLSWEKNAGLIYQKALGFGYWGLTREAFVKKLEKEQNELPGIKKILQRNNRLPVIYGSKPLDDQLDFLKDEIKAFHKGVERKRLVHATQISHQHHHTPVMATA